MASRGKHAKREAIARAEAQWAAQQGPRPFVLDMLASLVVFNLYGEQALYRRADEALSYGEAVVKPGDALQVGIALAQAMNDGDVFSLHRTMGADWASSPVNNVCVIAGAMLRRQYPHRYGLTANLSTVAA